MVFRMLLEWRGFMHRVDHLLTASGIGRAVLLTKPSNIYYFSGYTGEGMLLLAGGLSAIITDFRYVEQAGRQAQGFIVCQTENAMPHYRVAYGLLRDHHLNSLLFEDDQVTVKDMRFMAECMPGVELIPLDGVPERLRRIKDAGELQAIEKACAISCVAFEYICGYIKPGLTEKQVQVALDFNLLESGADSLAFSTIVASGVNGSLPHAIPGKRVVSKGDMITLDFGAKVGGYCADMTRTVAVGEPEPRLRDIYRLVQEAQQASQEALAPGKSCSAIDAIARAIIYNAGYRGYFGHGLGHCVGIDIHEEPRLKETSADYLETGHVITVEPGIYIPGLGGVRIENTCAITADSSRSFVYASRDLRIL
jgi:Xaa-Pro aminopeptidase